MSLPNQFGFAAEVIEAFTDGDCWALATALRLKTGWDIVALGFESEAEMPPAKRGWEHMAVRRPDGLILDITGLHAAEDWLTGWNCGFERDTVVFTANEPAYRRGVHRQFPEVRPAAIAEELLREAAKL